MFYVRVSGQNSQTATLLDVLNELDQCILDFRSDTVMSGGDRTITG